VKYTGVGAHSFTDKASVAISLNLNLSGREWKFHLLAIAGRTGPVVASFLGAVRSLASLLGYSAPAPQADYAIVAYNPSWPEGGRYRLARAPREVRLYVVGDGAEEVAEEAALDGKQLLLAEQLAGPIGKVKALPDFAARLVAERAGSSAVGAFDVEVEPVLLKGSVALAVQSDRGRVRGNNEDSGFTASVKVSSRGVPRVFRIIGVADGAGGHEFGELASSEAVLELLSVLLPGLAEGEEVAALLREGFKAANERVLALVRERGATMASTMSVAVVEGATVHVGHVGDSRVYMLSGGRALRLTTDHKPPTGPRNVITNALGLPSMWVELHAGAEGFRLEPGSILLAATDGLTELVSDSDILRLAREHARAPSSLCRELIKLANSRGGYDNITVAAMTQLTEIPA
jgi:protein phosphatase